MAIVLVAGATGETGQRVVRLLLNRGAQVRVLTRTAARAMELFGSEVEVFEGDVREPATLVGVGKGVSTAICAIGTRTYVGANGGPAVDAAGTRDLALALADDGIDQLVLLSAFGLDRQSPFLKAFSFALNGYFGFKEQAESSVRTSGVPYTIVRPVQFWNRPTRSPARLNQGEPLSLLRLVSRDLVAEVLVACVDNPHAIGKTFELCEGGSLPVDEQLAMLAPDASRPMPDRTPLYSRV